jgi:hypothetical protein
MIRLLFVPKQLIFNFPDANGIIHGQPNIPTLSLMACPHTRDRLLLPYVMSEEEKEEENAAYGEYKIIKFMVILGDYPLEIADFEWSCAKYGTALKISCEERPYASLPVYISVFCKKFLVSEGFCEYLRNNIATELQLPEGSLIFNEAEWGNQKIDWS